MYDKSKGGIAHMPDVASNTSPKELGVIDWVGMGNIHIPMVYRESAQSMSVQAQVQIYVNMHDVNARGIHMSRLYLQVERMAEITPQNFAETLNAFLHTHKGMSNASRMVISCDIPLRRPSLVSKNTGWRYYPSVIEGKNVNGKITFSLTTNVLYSSTCPCSKALAEQLIQRRFAEDFRDYESIDKKELTSWLEKHALYATPHSQRSKACVTVVRDDIEEPTFGLVELTNVVEDALCTPVQAAVKREDEQHFALLSGQNPMFCEDAARRIKKAMHGRYSVYKFVVRHYESLHAHDAVAMARSSDYRE